MHRFFTGILTVLLVIGLIGQSTSAAESPLELNVILSLTGQGAFIGKSMQDMLDAFQTTTNKRGGVGGRQLSFTYFDDQTMPQVAVQIANSLTAKQVPVILGPSIVATCRAVAPLVLKGPVQYCFSAGLVPPKNSYTFSVSASADDAIAVALRYFRLRGWRKIGRLTTTDATGQQADDAFTRWLALPENKELTVVADEHFAVTDLSTTAQMSRIKAAQPQVVVVWATGTPVGTALRAYGDIGLDQPVFVGNSNMTTAQGKQYASILPKSYYSTAPGYVANVAAPAAKQILADYNASIKAKGIANDYISGIVWDAVTILTQAYAKLGPNASAVQIRAYIEQLSSFPGIAGIYNFTDGSQRGLGQNNLIVMKYDASSEVWSSVSLPGGEPKK